MKFFPSGSKEHEKSDYQVLVADVNTKYQWVASRNGNVPNEAIQGRYNITEDTDWFTSMIASLFIKKYFVDFWAAENPTPTFTSWL